MKRFIESLVFTKFRTLFLSILGCATVLLLHWTFGGSQSPSNGPVDTFPRKIWQSWKTDALRFESRDAERATTWVQKNPSFRYEVLTDASAVTYVRDHYQHFRPDIVSVYEDLKSLRIIQADLLRYLIMYADGGVWADIDVQALRPVDHFIPKRHTEKDVDMVIGIETDEPKLKDHPVLGTKAQSFCQWTFMCKPRLPVMMRLIDNILVWLSNLSLEQGKPISELDLDFDQVLNGTGPSAFTSAILQQMSVTTGKKLTWDDFHGLEESRIVGGVLVLTSEAFAAGTGHSYSGNHHGKNALVKHHFHASAWTTHHPRLKHPIYGEVEKCNWDVECVRLWDANTAFFASLPKEDQRKMIELKEHEDTIAASKAKAESDGSPPGQPMGPQAPMPGPPPPDLGLQDNMHLGSTEGGVGGILAQLPSSGEGTENLAAIAPALAAGSSQQNEERSPQGSTDSSSGSSAEVASSEGSNDGAVSFPAADETASHSDNSLEAVAA